MLIAYITFAVGLIIACSFGEWALHGEVMHKRLRLLPFPYEAHTERHHRRFGFRASYHLGHGNTPEGIAMPFWAGPVVICLTSLPGLLLALLAGDWAFLYINTSITGVYFYTYEYVHYCMHRPQWRFAFVLRWRPVRWLDKHHRLHHEFATSNRNVVLPLADWALRTLR